jgi:hypothetical protein
LHFFNRHASNCRAALWRDAISVHLGHNLRIAQIRSHQEVQEVGLLNCAHTGSNLFHRRTDNPSHISRSHAIGIHSGHNLGIRLRARCCQEGFKII